MASERTQVWNQVSSCEVETPQVLQEPPKNPNLKQDIWKPTATWVTPGTWVHPKNLLNNPWDLFKDILIFHKNPQNLLDNPRNHLKSIWNHRKYPRTISAFVMISTQEVTFLSALVS